MNDTSPYDKIARTARAVGSFLDSDSSEKAVALRAELASCVLSLEELRVGRAAIADANAHMAELYVELEEAKEKVEEANNAKATFLATMSHELRTPMHGILGMTELLGATPLNHRQREIVDVVRRSGANLLELLNALLDYAKIEARKVELERVDFDLRVLVEDALELLTGPALARNVDVACLIAPDVNTVVRGDPGRIRQLVSNLIGNAVKFTERGAITVEVEIQPIASDSIEVLITVRDTGIGIAPEALGRLFRSFSQADSSTTRRYGGTGLGLAIASELAALMGGSLSVESEPGRGSSFICKLRLEPGIPACAALVTPIAHAKTARVLVPAGPTRRMLECELDRLGLAIVERDADISIENQPRFLRVADETAAVPDTTASIVKPVRRSSVERAIAVALKLRERPSLLETAPVDTSLPRSAEPRVLLVEDNPINREVAVAMLEQLGCSVRIATNGVEALAAVEASHLDLVFMDCHMPVMDGYSASRELRRRERELGRAHLSIVALTASAFAHDREACLGAGMDDFVSKPFAEADLAAVLRKWLPTTVGAAPAPLEPVTKLDDLVIIDEIAIAELRALRRPGRPDVLTRALHSWSSSSPSDIQKLTEAVHSGDHEAAMRIAHTLRGATASLGGKRLASLLMELEQHARAGSLATARTLLPALQNVHALTLKALAISAS